MTEKKETQEEVKITERTSEQACKEIEAIVALLNMRTTDFKYSQQGVGQKKEMIPSGAWEYSPLPPRYVEYLVATATALVQKFVEKGELVRFKEKVEAAGEEANKSKEEITDTTLPPKPGVSKEQVTENIVE